jgi:guanylate cyclase soluble subunit beta
VLVFLASPRLRSLLEMQQSHIYLSDIPLHDMTSDYILLAEQRHAEADLKEKYEKLTVELKVRKSVIIAVWLSACGSDFTRSCCCSVLGGVDQL